MEGVEKERICVGHHEEVSMTRIYICTCEAETTMLVARVPAFAPILLRTRIIGSFRHPCCPPV